jgi:hypothetical protein
MEPNALLLRFIKGDLCSFYSISLAVSLSRAFSRTARCSKMVTATLNTTNTTAALMQSGGGMDFAAAGLVEQEAG